MGGCRRRGFGFRGRKRCHIGGLRIGGGIFGRRPGFNIGGISGHRSAIGVNLAAGQTCVQPAPVQPIAVQPISAVVQPAPVLAPTVSVQSVAVIKIQKTITVLEVKLQKFEMQLASLKMLLIKLEVISRCATPDRNSRFSEISIGSGINQSHSISKFYKYS